MPIFVVVLIDDQTKLSNLKNHAALFKSVHNNINACRIKGILELRSKPN